MANNKDSNTEQTILEAAEEVFLSKGYAAARTTEIAKLAGVNHAMLHYYFRSKENLFDRVFDKKLKLLNDSFSIALEQDLPFLDKVKLAVETHFDFLMSDPKLPFFVLNEITVNPERKEVFKEILLPKIVKIFEILAKEIKTEIEKGTVVDISPANLLLNIGSLNACTIIASLVLFKEGEKEDEEAKEKFLKERRLLNVELILKGLKP